MGDSINVAARLKGIAPPGTICLSEDALSAGEGRIELVVSDLGSEELKNIAEPVRVYLVHVSQSSRSTPTSAYASMKSAAPHLSIVVLPFANIGSYLTAGALRRRSDGDPHDRLLAHTRRGRNRARYGICLHKGRPIDAKMIGGELNVRYVLKGRVQRSAGRIRFNVQLIDAEEGHHLWAERFDKTVADLFDMQDEIVARLTGPLNGPLVAAKARRAEQNSATHPHGPAFSGIGLVFNKVLKP